MFVEVLRLSQEERRELLQENCLLSVRAAFDRHLATKKIHLPVASIIT